MSNNIIDSSMNDTEVGGETITSISENTNINENDVDVASIISNSSLTQTQAADNYILQINEENSRDPEHSKYTSIEENIKKSMKNNNISMDINKFISFVKDKYPKKLGFGDVENAIKDSFYSKQEYYSAAFDMIASYVKGQKILYMESARFCSDRLNFLMLPTIFFSAIASVLSLSVNIFEWGPILVSSINAVNGFLLSVISYSKLDAASEAHKISSHQYDKLQSLCEFTSGCIMVLPSNKNESVTEITREKLTHIEKKIKDIKETNGFMIPEYVQTLFPNIFITNIFSKIKEFANNESVLINKLKDILNDMRELEFHKKLRDLNHEEEETYYHLKHMIQNNIEAILDIRTKYSEIDNMFKTEIQAAHKTKRRTSRLYTMCCL